MKMQTEKVLVLVALLVGQVGSAFAATLVKWDATCPADSTKYYVAYQHTGRTDREFVCGRKWKAGPTSAGILEIEQAILEKIGNRWMAIVNIMPLND